MKLFIDSDNLITLVGLYDNVADAYVNTAGVIAQVFAASDEDTQIGSDVTLSYIAASDGEYRGQLVYGTALAVNETYIVKIVASSGGNQLTVKVNADGAFANES